MWRASLKLTGSLVMKAVPKLLFFSGVFSGREDGVEDVLGVCVGQILGIDLEVLHQKGGTFACFLPELETRTGFEYLTRL